MGPPPLKRSLGFARDDGWLRRTQTDAEWRDLLDFARDDGAFQSGAAAPFGRPRCRNSRPTFTRFTPSYSTMSAVA